MLSLLYGPTLTSIHESSEVLVTQSCLTLCDPMNCSLSGSSAHGIPQARILESGAIYLSGDLPDSGSEPWSPGLQEDSLPSEPPGKPIMTTGKTIALIRWTFVGKVMSLLFNMLSRLVIASLPRSKHLLISWLLSSSAVIFELKKIKFLNVSIVSLSIGHEVMGEMP